MDAPQKTALYDRHEDHGARMVPFAGFLMPLQYDGILVEHARVREQIGLFDVSHMGEVRVRGGDALDAVNGFITNDIHRIEDGRALYTAMCAEDGTIVDDLIVYRLAADDLLICVNASNRATDFAHMQAHTTGDATLVDEGDQWAQIAIQGPRAPELLGRLFGDEIQALKPFRIRSVTLGDKPAYVSTTGYTGEPGAEVYLAPSAAGTFWSDCLERGSDLGAGPAGLGARDTLRLEMGYCLYGNDIDRTTTPLEAGLGWVTRLGKDAFVGREALIAQKESGVPRRLVGLEVGDRGIPRQGYDILHEGITVGQVTSGTRSPSTGKSIGLGYVPTSLKEPGTELHVDCRGRLKPATVTKAPFYTPTR
ncbi:MAG: glycine cleavage system aminomethyltransferase GcvT [Myxococcota bacterium]|nr:glycine cleavage system aminomethyltransferase GcvT [Myxococcota bacterium]